MQTLVVGRTWPSSYMWFADPCTGAIGIKRSEQMQETVRSSNQELMTDWLREREESGLPLWAATPYLPIRV